MAIGEKKVIITIDVVSGEYEIQHTNGVVYTENESVKAEIEEIRKTRTHKRIAEILLTPTNEGCLYWDGNRWVRYC